MSDTDGDRPGSSQYLRHLCHELRQPLVVAVGYVALLEDGSFGVLPAEAAPYLRIVGERLDALNAILDRVAEDAAGAAE